jgi:hypothetical protein
MHVRASIRAQGHATRAQLPSARRCTSMRHAHLGPDHAAAGCVCEEVIVVVADEGGRVRHREAVKLLGIGQARAVGGQLRGWGMKGWSRAGRWGGKGVTDPAARTAAHAHTLVDVSIVLLLVRVIMLSIKCCTHVRARTHTRIDARNTHEHARTHTHTPHMRRNAPTCACAHAPTAHPLQPAGLRCRRSPGTTPGPCLSPPHAPARCPGTAHLQAARAARKGPAAQASVRE